MPHDGHDHQHHHHGPHGHDHNQPPSRATQWQTPHLPHHGDHLADDRPDDEHRDLDLVEKAFCEGFGTASDPVSFLRLARIPFVGRRGDGTLLRLLRVEHRQGVDIGSLTPHLGGGSFRYAPLPAAMASRRHDLGFVYFDGTGQVTLTMAEVRALTPEAVDGDPGPGSG